MRGIFLLFLPWIPCHCYLVVTEQQQQSVGFIAAIFIVRCIVAVSEVICNQTASLEFLQRLGIQLLDSLEPLGLMEVQLMATMKLLNIMVLGTQND